MKLSAADIQRALKDIDYPANKDELIRHAQSHGADREIMDALRQFPDQEYDSAVDVSQAFGAMGR